MRQKVWKLKVKKAQEELEVAKNIDYDLHNCEWKAADSKKKVKLFRRINFWITNPKAETIYTHMVRECMKGRNHNVLN